jgi:hypothetical protein
MRTQATFVITAALALGACGGQQTQTASNSQTRGSGGASDTAHDDAGAIANANPCGDRPPARLPDGGVNPEACVGACSLIRAPGPQMVTDGGLAPATGTIDLRQVDFALRREARSLRGCYDQAVIAHPWLAQQGGVVNVRFIIEANGHVRPSPTATGLDQVPEVASCLGHRVRYIVFPAPEGGPAEIAVPFNFDGAT